MVHCIIWVSNSCQYPHTWSLNRARCCLCTILIQIYTQFREQYKSCVFAWYFQYDSSHEIQCNCCALFNVMSEILATKAFKSNFSGVGGCGRDSWLTTFQLRFFVCYLFVCLFYGSVLIPTQAFIGPL